MRTRLCLLAVAFPLFAVGWLACGSDSVDGATGDAGADAAPPPAPDQGEEPPDGDGGLPPSIPDSGPGDGGTIPSKIRYVIVIIKENHTFDNYFTGFPNAESSMTALRSNGTVVTRPIAPMKPLTSDLCHANCCAVEAYSNGKMNHFSRAESDKTPACPYVAGGDQAFYRYTEAQIPNYWQYARNFVLADHFFSTSLAPSSPGHEVFWASQSMTIDNPTCDQPGGKGCKYCDTPQFTATAIVDPDQCTLAKRPACFDVPTLVDHLPTGFTWESYGSAIGRFFASKDPNYASHFRSTADLLTDLRAGRLANLTFAHALSPHSEHPPEYPCDGENFTVDVINAAMALPQWEEMAIVLTWDDYGGFYDHVKPNVHTCPSGGPLGTGYRLPLMVISPYAKKGEVLKSETEQASVPRLIEDLWGMPLMVTRNKFARDGVAGSLMGAFDFNQAPRPPVVLTPHACPQ